jgi:hypothetical protein
MRGDRFVSIAVALAVLLAAGCASTTQRHTTSSAAPAPAPSDPDLGAVLERFYEGIEDRRWAFAYAMLSPRYERALSRNDFTALYDRFADVQVVIRQTTERSAVATLRTKEHATAAASRRFEETWTFAWDGERWVLDGLRRRELPAVPAQRTNVRAISFARMGRRGWRAFRRACEISGRSWLQRVRRATGVHEAIPKAFDKAWEK